MIQSTDVALGTLHDLFCIFELITTGLFTGCQFLRCRQQCIPAGCVLPALYRTGDLCAGGICPGGSLSRGSLSKGAGGSLSRGSLSGRPLCPVDRQTPVKLLPCPKLRLRAVNIFEKVFSQASMLTLTYCQLRFIFEKRVC